MSEAGECKVNPEYYERRLRRHRAIRRVLLFTVSFIVITVLLLAVIAFITWLVLRPIHSPSWEVDDMKLLTLNIQSTDSRRRLQTAELPSSLTLRDHNDWGITTFLLNADMVIAWRASNRNHHMEITYDRIDMRVAYATATFATARFLPFTQTKRNCTVVATEVKAMSVPVTFILANALQAEIERGSVGVQVLVDGRAKVRIGTYRSFGFRVKTVCELSMTTPGKERVGELIAKNCHRY